MEIDFTKLSLDELNEVIEKATEARNELFSARRAELLSELKKLDDLQSGKAPSKPIVRRPSKRSFKDGNGNSWTGIGPKPAWLRAHLEAGAKLEDFLVS